MGVDLTKLLKQNPRIKRTIKRIVNNSTFEGYLQIVGELPKEAEKPISEIKSILRKHYDSDGELDRDARFFYNSFLRQQP